MAHETVLVAEDDRIVRDLVSRVLREEGYEVLPHASPREAMEAAKTHQGEIQLLLSDVVMSEMNGLELARALREERPAMRALFMSGYSEHPALREEVASGRAPFLQKPFSTEDLKARVREVLDSEVEDSEVEDSEVGDSG